MRKKYSLQLLNEIERENSLSNHTYEGLLHKDTQLYGVCTTTDCDNSYSRSFRTLNETRIFKCECHKTQKKTMNTLTRDELILLFNEANNNQYDYSRTDYVNNRTHITVTCREHGDFKISPSNHKKGHGCRSCGIKKQSASSLTTRDDFIHACNIRHDYAFDYSLTIYTNCKNKIVVICKKKQHTSELEADSHKRGTGCRFCATENVHKQQRTPIEYFIHTVVKLYGDKFDYTRISETYSCIKSHINIKCNTHNIWFSQIASSHLNGYNGCSECEVICCLYNVDKHIEERKSTKTPWFMYQMPNGSLRTIKGVWGSKNYPNIERHKKYIEYLGEIKEYTEPCHWYNIRTNDFENNYGTQLLDRYYGSSYIKLLKMVYPEYTWNKSKFNKVGCSFGQIQWLNFIEIRTQDIRHKYNHDDGEFPIPHTKYHVDGYSEKENCIYEYDGDWCHGNPDIYHHAHMHPVYKKTFGELYENTQTRRTYCENKGYNVYSIWESEWKRGIRATIKLQRKFRKYVLLFSNLVD
jgi:hypothetical protein